MASSPNSRRSSTTKDEEGADATDFSKLVLQEIGFVKESFEAVKMKASQKIDQANEAQKQFEELMVLPAERAEERDYKLRQLKIKVSKLRMEIPFKFIAPEEQPHPHITRWRRPESDLYQDKQISDSNPDRDDKPAPPVPYHMILLILAKHEFPLREQVAFFFFFPKNSVIKRRVIFSLLTCFLGSSDRGVGVLVEKGLVQAVYKKSNLTVDGYRMHPSVHSFLRSEPTGFRESVDIYVGRCHDVEQKYIYHTTQDFEQFNNNDTGHQKKTILHLGKWNNSTEQHIEIINPELFFKEMLKYTELSSVSLCGISMIKELPEFITKLKKLEYLDLRACHNLEVIPPSIANLIFLAYLDISECYFLDHLPKALASLIGLRVLKGFVVGENKDGKSCSLQDLASLRYLVKLNIYTSMKRFPTNSQLETLQRFELLRSLTISRGGCSAPNGLAKPVQEDEYERLEELIAGDHIFHRLEKLDLQCVPETVTPRWLKPSNFKNLKKLYIRGGKFFDLGQSSSEGSQWNVETLRLKHLCKLNMDWGELQWIFPKLMCLEKVDCPNLHQFPCNDNGIWMKNQPA